MTTTATSKIQTMTVAHLAAAFDATESLAITEDIATVRGWIMDELEARLPKSFAAWMDNLGMSACQAFGVQA